MAAPPAPLAPPLAPVPSAAPGLGEGAAGAPDALSAAGMLADQFVQWFHSSEPDMVLRRTAVEQRIERLALPFLTVIQRTQEKVWVGRAAAGARGPTGNFNRALILRGARVGKTLIFAPGGGGRRQVIARRNRRVKAMRDRQLRSATTLNRTLTDANAKGLARLTKFATTHAQQIVR